MKDPIERQAAIDALVKAIRKDPYYDSNEAINGLGVCDVRVILNDLPSAQQEPQWIPVSERLPEDWVPVLVTLKKPERLPAWIKAKPENYFHIVDADVCENGEWSVNKKNVTAWMPLPEPYRAERRIDGRD